MAQQRRPIDVITGLRNTRRSLGDGTLGGRSRIATPKREDELRRGAPSSKQLDDPFVRGFWPRVGSRRLFVSETEPDPRDDDLGDLWVDLSLFEFKVRNDAAGWDLIGSPPSHGHSHDTLTDVSAFDHHNHDGLATDPHGQGQHDGSVAASPHGDADHDEAKASDPHGNASHSPGMVEDPTGTAPSLRRSTRAAQPAPGTVGVGSRHVIEDESNIEEVAADTTGDGTADTWVVVGTDPAHNHDPTYVNVGGDTMGGPLSQDRGGIGRHRVAHVADGTRNYTTIDTEDDSGNVLRYAQYGPADLNRHEFRGAVRYVNDVDFRGLFSMDRGGVGSHRVFHTDSGTRNFTIIETQDDAGGTLQYVQYGPAETSPRHELRGNVLLTGTNSDLNINHGDITLDGGDVIANKSSHGGNIVAQGWIDSQESVVASTYMRATNKMGVMTSGSATNPTIRFDASSSLGIPHCGFYKNTDVNGNHRVAVAGDDNAIAGFHPASLNRSVFPRSDGGADLGDTDAAWDTVHAYNINTLSDSILKADLRAIDSTEASERVRRTAQAAVGFRWTDGRRTHLGFDADKVGQAHGDQSAAFVDPAVNGDEGTGSLDGSHTEPHKAIRPVELIPDLYAAVSQLLDRVDALENA